MNNVKIIIGFVIIHMLFGCEKDQPVCICPRINVERPLNQAVKDCYLFKEGSWWVYEELNSGQRDSVYVNSFTTEWSVSTSSCLHNSPWDEQETDIYDTIFITNKESAKVYQYSTYYMKEREYRFNTTNLIWTSWDGPNGVSRPNEYYWFILDADDTTSVITEELSSLDLADYSFTNLYKLSHFHSQAYLNWDDWPYNDTVVYYLAPNIGLVKRDDLAKDQVWELKNYNIVQ
ncbi:MAG: hypothetical protein COB85_09035 [Bacteroidetes bacterium]|nr:MAG: hypothetical protein COB85_09035 [Bacteroidota bacterium]